MKSNRFNLKTVVLVATSCLMCAGTSCPVPSIGITCGNPLVSADLGFRLTLPNGFVCRQVPGVQQEFLLAWVEYENTVSGVRASVLVLTPVGGGNVTNNPSGTATDLGTYDSASGITFELIKVTTSTGQTAYSALGPLPADGRLLFVSLAAPSANDALVGTLKTILDSVVLL